VGDGEKVARCAGGPVQSVARGRVASGMGPQVTGCWALKEESSRGLREFARAGAVTIGAVVPGCRQIHR